MMPDNWIGRIYITDEVEVTIIGTDEKIHDLISCAQGTGVTVDQELHPILWDKLGGPTGDISWDDVQWVTNSGTGNNLKTPGGDPASVVTNGSGTLEYNAHFDAQVLHTNDTTGGASIAITQAYTISIDVTQECFIVYQSGDGILFGFSNIQDSHPAGIWACVKDGNFAIAYHLATETGLRYLTSAVPVPVNSLLHVVLEVDISGDTWDLYVDGSLTVTSTIVQDSTVTAVPVLGNHYTSIQRDSAVFVGGGHRITIDNLRYGGSFTPPTYPLSTGDYTEPEIPDMLTLSGSPWPYKIIADAT